ncbi:MAG: tRNA guanosine(34) transglycosylase Tgt [Patescibacteria group bacterium]
MGDFPTFQLQKKDSTSGARLGRLTTAHGVVETPSYVVVGTDANIRCLLPEDIPGTKTQAVIANTYHLWRELKDEGLNEFPGLHRVMEWEGVIMTDSGGFQVFSLGVARRHGVGKIGGVASRNIHVSAEEEEAGGKVARITEAGVYFEESGEELYLDAEISMRIQGQLGADIIFAFDEPTSPESTYAETKEAMERTHRWEKRSLDARSPRQMLYGIVQGGVYEDLRKESARALGSLPFDGFAIGGAFGASFGHSKEKTFEEIRWATPFLPEGKPRHLLGIGRVEDIFEAVALGMDTFDCVIPTREARHGAIWTREGRYDIKKGKYAAAEEPLEDLCACLVCASGVLKKDLYARFREKDFEAGRIATIHNVYFFNNLMEEIRNAIREGRFLEFKTQHLRKGGI